MEIMANAKINLSLDVVGKREDGYHLLQTIMHPIALCDNVRVQKRDCGISVEIGGGLEGVGGIPLDERNTAYKAAMVFFEDTGIKGGADIFLGKKVPFGAGLGGGSSDAWSVLYLLSELYNAKLAPHRLASMAARVGADVPFFALNKTVLAEGVGERLTQLPPLPECTIVLLMPKIAVSTKEAFERLKWDKLSAQERPDTQLLMQALRGGDLRTFARNMKNVLEGVTFVEHKILRDYKERLLLEGALGAVMSGSGSSIFGVFPYESDVDYIKNIFDCPCFISRTAQQP